MDGEKFWETKELEQMSDSEWESLCDGCGRCCFRKIIDGHLWKKRILYTRVACDLLDLENFRCSKYECRFDLQRECIKLDRAKVREFKWLPETCAYRLLSEGRKLCEWHPLVCGESDSLRKADICIKNGIHECDADDWYKYVLE